MLANQTVRCPQAKRRGNRHTQGPFGFGKIYTSYGCPDISSSKPPHCIQTSFKGPIGQTEIQQGLICQFFLTLCRSGGVKLMELGDKDRGWEGGDGRMMEVPELKGSAGNRRQRG